MSAEIAEIESGPVSGSPGNDVLTRAEAREYSIRPNGDRVLVKRWKDRETFDEGGRIVKADISKEKTHIGTVLAIGPGRPLENGGRGQMFAEVGMTVFFGTFAGNELPSDYFAEDLVLMRDDELHGELKVEASDGGRQENPE